MASIELQTELNDIATLIRAAHLAGDIDKEDALEMRKRKLPRMIEVATNEEDLAEVTQLKAQISAMAATEKATNAQLIEAQQQAIFWQKEEARLSNIHNGLFAQSLGLQAEINRIEAEMRVRKDLAEIALSGKPMMVSDSFFRGLGPAKLKTLSLEEGRG
jgi:flagellar biosynthesis GTPase FlhF